MKKEEFMKLANGSDVRGVAVAGVDGEPINLTSEAVNRITSAFVQFLENKLGKSSARLTIAIGHDARISSPQLVRAAEKSMAATGVKILDCGLASTPAMFMSILFEETDADGAIMLTASHLPYNRNGMKFFTADGGLENKDIQEILQMAGSLPECDVVLPEVQHYDLISLYASHLRKIICTKLDMPLDSHPFRGMHIVVDAGNGNGGFFVDKILRPLGAETQGSQFLEPDGMFPNHMPNPEDKKAMAALKKAVLDNRADLGLIFDTDVDRMGAVLSDGEEVGRNALIAMMAAILAPDYPGSTIVTDSVTSDELTEFLEGELGLKHHRYRRGYKNVINECIRLNKSYEVSPLAIETSGHGALSENFYLDDGAYLAIKLLIAAAKLKKDGKNLSSLIAKLGHPAESYEYRLKIVGKEQYKQYGEEVLETFAKRAKQTGFQLATPSFEGVRVIFPTGWALLRMSLHDPNMPLNIESREKGGCASIASVVQSLLGGFEALDMSMLC